MQSIVFFFKMGNGMNLFDTHALNIAFKQKHSNLFTSMSLSPNCIWILSKSSHKETWGQAPNEDIQIGMNTICYFKLWNVLGYFFWKKVLKDANYSIELFLDFLCICNKSKLRLRKSYLFIFLFSLLKYNKSILVW